MICLKELAQKYKTDEKTISDMISDIRNMLPLNITLPSLEEKWGYFDKKLLHHHLTIKLAEQEKKETRSDPRIYFSW